MIAPDRVYLRGETQLEDSNISLAFKSILEALEAYATISRVQDVLKGIFGWTTYPGEVPKKRVEGYIPSLWCNYVIVSQALVVYNGALVLSIVLTGHNQNNTHHREFDRCQRCAKKA
jgi:hypothetical protein